MADEALSVEARGILTRLARAHEIPFSGGLLPHAMWLSAAETPRLRYLYWGGRGPTVLLLHGGGLTAHSWDLVALALSRDHACVALDLRGHGHSAWTDDYRIEAAVRDVLALIARLDAGPVHLVGMSLGGNLAGHVAAANPEGVASLAFVDVAPEVSFGATARMRAFMGSAVPVDSVASLVAHALALVPHQDPDTLTYRYMHMLRPTEVGWVWRHDTRRPFDFDHVLGKLKALGALAPCIRVPTTVYRGGRSRVLNREDAAAFAALFPNGAWLEIANAGHNVQEDNPAALAAALREHVGAAIAADGSE